MSLVIPEPHHSRTFPYILISGSYTENPENDAICKILGAYLSRLNVGLVSGASQPGLNVSLSFCRVLDAEDRYDVDRVVFYLRRKERDLKAVVSRMGCVKFDGGNAQEMRQKMIGLSKAVIVIGGQNGTLEEEQMAVARGLPVIPLPRSGGSAFNLWNKYCKSTGYVDFAAINMSTFSALNDSNIHHAIEATCDILKAVLAMP